MFEDTLSHLPCINIFNLQDTLKGGKALILSSSQMRKQAQRGTATGPQSIIKHVTAGTRTQV